MSYPKEQQAHSDCTATTSEIFFILFQTLREVLGITSTSIILYRLGESIGNQMYRKLMQEVVEKDLLQTHFQRCKLTLIDFDLRSGKIVVRSKSTLLGSKLKNLGIPIDFICSGCIAGILGRIMNKEVFCEEKSCIARGDEYCEFFTAFIKDRRKIEIKFNEEEVKEGLERILRGRQFPFLEGPPFKKMYCL